MVGALLRRRQPVGLVCAQQSRDPWAAHVLPWVEFAQNTDVDLPMILPRRMPTTNQAGIAPGVATGAPCGCAKRSRRSSGPSYSDFDGRTYPLNADDRGGRIR